MLFIDVHLPVQALGGGVPFLGEEIMCTLDFCRRKMWTHPMTACLCALMNLAASFGLTARAMQAMGGRGLRGVSSLSDRR